jgi:mitochondrial fission protein ELM1
MSAAALAVTSPSSAGSQPAREPLVWLLRGCRCGDHAQALALAGALGWPFIVKPIGPDADALTPPWPDLVVSAGREGEAAVRRIRERAAGLPVRFVHLGRPFDPPARFDLVVTTPQYHVPPCANVIEIPLPLHGISPRGLAEARRRWAASVAHLPGPRVAVLVGGSTGRFTLDRIAATRLARAASDLARRRGGSLLVTTSYRTPPEVADVMRHHLDVPAVVHRWRPDPGDANPYLGFLALAAEIVVTGDSVSMLAEAAATGKPVHIFDLEPRAADTLGSVRDLRAWLKAVLHSAGQGLLPRRLRRDIRVIHANLLASGRAVRLGHEPGAPKPAPPDAGPVVAERVARLVLSGAHREPAAPSPGTPPMLTIAAPAGDGRSRPLTSA